MNRGRGRGGGTRKPGEEHNGFNNPQYAPTVQHVDPDWDRDIRNRLDKFAQGNEPHMILPPMERHERKRVHELARRYNLMSTSQGREPHRICMISRKRQQSLMSVVAADETTPIGLTKDMRTTIAAYVNKYPIQEKDVEEHLVVKPRIVKSRPRESFDRGRMGVPPLPNTSSDMINTRKQLPAFQLRQQLIDAIESNTVTLVTGGTGCGKTTQVPQYLLENANKTNKPLRIICTQPRRLPAISIAERVAKERGEKLGGTVGYHIRLEQRSSADTVLTYCTSGVLLRMLTHDDSARDISHIILDEIHEREQNTDYLLIALKQALKKRTDLKIILMSATMEGNLKMFTQYFDSVAVKHIDIPSRLYHVEKFFLGDILAMTGYAPAESIYGGMFMSGTFGSFPEVNSWSMKPSGSTTTTGRYNKKDDWNMDDWSTDTIPKTAVTMQTVQTTPNLATATNQPPGMVTSSSTSSMQQLQAKAAVPTECLMSVAQQLANTSSTQQPATSNSSFYASQQQPARVSSQQFGQPSQQTMSATSLQQVQQMNGTTYYVAPQTQQYPQYGAQATAYPAGQAQQYAAIQPQDGTTVMHHAATWGGGMDQMQISTSADVIDLPLDASHQEAMEQFRQLNTGYMTQDTSYVWQDSSASMVQPQQPAWQHTQSYSVMPQHQLPTQPTTTLQSWDQRQTSGVYQPGQLINGAQFATPAQAKFFVPADSQESGLNAASMNYFGQPMDGTCGYASQPIVATSFGAQPQTLARATSVEKPIQIEDFGVSMRREQEEANKMRQIISQAIPSRPTSFSPNIRDLMRHHGVNQSALVNMYLKCGGTQFLDNIDLDLAMEVIKYVMNSSIPGGVLIFLPGYEEITKMKEKINEHPWGQGGIHPVVFMLHSQMNTNDQHKCFEKIGHNQRKVILSTNISEASLTIEDIVFVIDCGKAKEKTYDHMSRISQLKITWIAKSNAEQRSGRAGRVREGYCFRLYSQEEYDTMLVTQTAEMQRTAIHDVCLHAKIFAPDRMTVKQFLELAPEPPPGDAIDSSMKFLEQLGALFSDEIPEALSTSNYFGGGTIYNRTYEMQREPELTDLGKLVAQLPLDPQISRLLLFGLSLRCLGPVVTLAALLSHREPFVIANQDEREHANRQRDVFGRRDFSDHITLLRAFYEFEKVQTVANGSNFCRQHYLSYSVMKMVTGIRRQLLIELKRSKLIHYDGDPMSALSIEQYNKYNGNWHMVQAAIVAGCYPGIGFVKGSKMKKIKTSTEAAATLHPSSVIKRQMGTPSKKLIVERNAEGISEEDPTIEYLAFQELAKIDEGLTLRCVTVVPPVVMMLFAGSIRLKPTVIEDYRIVAKYTNEADEDDYDDEEANGFPRYFVLELESWIAVRGKFQDMQRLLQLRFKMMSYLLESLHSPSVIYEEKPEHVELLETIAHVLAADHARMHFNKCELPQVPGIQNRPTGQQYWNNNQYYATKHNNYNNGYQNAKYNNPQRQESDRAFEEQRQQHETLVQQQVQQPYQQQQQQQQYYNQNAQYYQTQQQQASQPAAVPTPATPATATSATTSAAALATATAQQLQKYRQVELQQRIQEKEQKRLKELAEYEQEMAFQKASKSNDVRMQKQELQQKTQQQRQPHSSEANQTKCTSNQQEAKKEELEDTKQQQHQKPAATAPASSHSQKPSQDVRQTQQQAGQNILDGLLAKANITKEPAGNDVRTRQQTSRDDERTERNTRDYRDTRDSRDNRDTRDHRDTRSYRDARDNRDTRDHRDNYSSGKDFKGHREQKDYQTERQRYYDKRHEEKEKEEYRQHDDERYNEWPEEEERAGPSRRQHSPQRYGNRRDDDEASVNRLDRRDVMTWQQEQMNGGAREYRNGGGRRDYQRGGGRYYEHDEQVPEDPVVKQYPYEDEEEWFGEGSARGQTFDCKDTMKPSDFLPKKKKTSYYNNRGDNNRGNYDYDGRSDRDYNDCDSYRGGGSNYGGSYRKKDNYNKHGSSYDGANNSRSYDNVGRGGNDSEDGGGRSQRKPTGVRTFHNSNTSSSFRRGGGNGSGDRR